MLYNVTLWFQLKSIFEMGWDKLLWFNVGEACNVKVIWTHAGEAFLCDIFDIWQQRGSCKANRSSFSQILPVDSCIFDDQLDTRDCQGRSGPFVTLRQLKPSLALQLLTYHIVYFHHFDDGGFPENQIFSFIFWTEYAWFQTIRIPSRCLWSLALWITKNGFLHLQITNAEAASHDVNGIQTVANKIYNYLVSAN